MNKSIVLFFLVLTLIGLIHVSGTGHASETGFKFQRMWPNLKQPFKVGECASLTIDKNNNIHVVDKVYACVHKFTSDGFFITKWGKEGSGDGEFKDPYGIAVDSSGNIYVADSGNSRIQKFSSNGTFIFKWGTLGIENGNFILPTGIEVDSSDNVYVTDDEKAVVQKFTSDGTFLLKWGKRGTGDGRFENPAGIAVDSSNHIYVGDRTNNTIQKFTSEGIFVSGWGGYGFGYGKFDFPYGLAVDDQNNIYISDRGNSLIQKFSSNGVFISQWGNYGIRAGEFYAPQDIAIDSNGIVYITEYIFPNIYKYTTSGSFISQFGADGKKEGEFDLLHGLAVDSNDNVYVADLSNCRVQKFDSDGEILKSWGEEGNENGNFKSPYAIAVGKDNSIYVTDIGNHRIQKFSSDGVFIAKWGSYGYGDGQFYYPNGIAVDSHGNVYVSDNGNYAVGYDKPRIQKFTSSGKFLLKWGRFGTGSGEFIWPEGIAIDSDDTVYVVDTGSTPDFSSSDLSYPGIHRFAPDGTFLSKFGTFGTGEGEFRLPKNIAFDPEGYLYVSDSENHRIQKLTLDGLFLSQWGSLGTNPNQFHHPNGIAIGTDSAVYVADTLNHRIQKFKPYQYERNNKAIIIAGGGAYPTNTLWDATRMSANFAYRTLTGHGYVKESICYLSEDTGLDLDMNGEADDVAGDCNAWNIEYAITEWAADADNLIIYLVDHGGEGLFLMSGFKALPSTDLAQWITRLQTDTGCHVTVIYDACKSGSFISDFVNPTQAERIVITSTSPHESAYFMNQGSVSFSNFFWTYLFNGSSINDAFVSASEAMVKAGFQNPLMDDNGNGIGNDSQDGLISESVYVGSERVVSEKAPTIGKISENQFLKVPQKTVLYAENVTADDPISRVWAIIQPPDFYQDDFEAVQSLPSVELIPEIDISGSRTGKYQAEYDRFTAAGTYRIMIYARDFAGNTAIPKLTSVTVGNFLKNRVVIAMGCDISDSIYTTLKSTVKLAYQSLVSQGYSDDDIFCMAPESYFEGVDARATKSGIKHAIENWAGQTVQDVIVYFIGTGGDGIFHINDTESLSSSELNSWMNTLGEQISGRVTFIYDAARSGSFILPSGQDRVYITSSKSDQPAHFLGNGDICFSQYFWNQVLKGANLMNAFITTSKALDIFTSLQTPQLDANGDGNPNSDIDLSLARRYVLGNGIILADDELVIGKISDPQSLNDTTSATITVKEITSLNKINKIWAVITPPDHEIKDPDIPVLNLPVMIFNPSNNDEYQGTYDQFDTYGTYKITVYAQDSSGNISFPVATTVTQKQNPEKIDITGFTLSGTPLANVPVHITVNAVHKQNAPLHYRYSTHKGYGSSGYDGLHWESMTDTEWIPEPFTDYTFTEPGKYIVVVWVTDNPADFSPNGIPIIGWSVNMNNDVCRTDITGYETTGNHEMNTPVRFAVTATNPCSGMLYYRFSMHPHYGTSGYDGLHWQSMTDTEWIPEPFTDYTFTESGKYIVVVWVTDNPADFSPNGIPIIGWSMDIE